MARTGGRPLTADRRDHQGGGATGRGNRREHHSGKLDTPTNWVLSELIEAGPRSGHAELAHDALEQLSAMTRAAGTDWALGLEARSRALLSEHEASEELYREAVERLGRTRVRGEHARAHHMFTGMGMEALPCWLTCDRDASAASHSPRGYCAFARAAPRNEGDGE